MQKSNRTQTYLILLLILSISHFLNDLMQSLIPASYPLLKAKYSLDFKRRAYSIGAFYDTNSESLGIQFNISNFGILFPSKNTSKIKYFSVCKLRF